MFLLMALALSIGVFALIATGLFLNPRAVVQRQAGQALNAWASFLQNGGKKDSITKTIIGLSAGAVTATAWVRLAGKNSALGSLVVPVAVGIGSVLMALMADILRTPLIPSTAHGLGSAASLILLGKDRMPAGAGLPIVAPIRLGASFGRQSKFVGGKPLKS